jgi:hypothetical protein
MCALSGALRVRPVRRRNLRLDLRQRMQMGRDGVGISPCDRTGQCRLTAL